MLVTKNNQIANTVSIFEEVLFDLPSEVDSDEGHNCKYCDLHSCLKHQYFNPVKAEIDRKAKAEAAKADKNLLKSNIPQKKWRY